MSSIPKKGSTLEVVGKYMYDKGLNNKSMDESNNSMIDKFAKRYNFEPADILDQLQRCDGKIPLNEQFPKVTPNLAHSSLSVTQKIAVRDCYPDANARDLATYMRTSVQNINLAKRGEFVEPIPQPAPDSTRPYGPLTYDEQVDVRDSKATHNTTMLAVQYNTHYNNVYRAQRGEFPKPHALRKAPSKRPFGPLSLQDKREIRDHRSEEAPSVLAKEYNTNHGNVTRAQQGLFKDNTPAGPSIHEQHSKLLTGLMGKGYVLCLDGNSSTSLDDMIKEILA